MKKTLWLYFILISYWECKGQEVVGYKNLKFVGYSYHGTLNKTFINKRTVFLNGKDSIIFNIKTAIDLKTKNIYDPGIFYNCKLKTDSIYSFILKKITPFEIPKEYNTYYRTNAVFDTKRKSRFKEIKKDTKYMFVGNSGIYIDINHELFQITKMTPAGDCVFQL